MDDMQPLRMWEPGQDVTQAATAEPAAKAKAQPRRRRTLSEQIAAEDEQIARHREAKRKLEAKARERERKARTRRLIEVGATLEAGVGAELNEDMRRALSRWLAAPLVDAAGAITQGEWLAAELAEEARRER